MAEFTVAIELGSSKITGIAGRKNKDGSISILALAQEDGEACIRKGVVYNIDKTVQALSNIIKKLEVTLKTRIAHVYVGFGGQSIMSVKNTNVRELSTEGEVTQEMINELMDANRSMQYPDKQILDAVTQEFKVDNQYQAEPPVGVPCKRLEGNFLNILCRREFYRRLKKCFDQANISILDMYISPLVLADSILTDAEKRGGCVLVDLGADTTTVSIYHRNILRKLTVLPLGSSNITKDIATLQMEEGDAEKMKIKYASAYTDANDIDPTFSYPIDKERVIDMPKFVDIVEARVREIIENVKAQIPDEYMDKLLGGIILTGGGSNMRNTERAFRLYTHIEKIRTAKFVNETIKSSNPIVNAKDGRLCTVLAILAEGDQNCAGNDITGELFEPVQPKPTVQQPQTATPNPTANPTGRVMEEVPKAPQNTANGPQKPNDSKTEEKEEEENPKPTHKFFSKFKAFMKKMTEPDEEDK
jgi:cell division protein FtsA